MVDIVAVARDRQGRAYQEQTWAVALVVGFAALVLGHRDAMVHAVGVRGAAALAGIVGALATLFVWSRHAIYVHYEELLRRGAPAEPGPLEPPGVWTRLARPVALWSGVTFYSTITLGLTGVAMLFLSR